MAALTGIGLLTQAYAFPSLSVKAKAPSVSCWSGGKKKKEVWVWTKSKEVMTTSLEGGWDTFLFTPPTQHLYQEWSLTAKINPLFFNDGQIYDSNNMQIAQFTAVSCPDDLRNLESLVRETSTVVVDILDWQIINAENVIAAFQHNNVSIFATARSANEAQVLLEALERGTDGIVLMTEEIKQVLELKSYLSSKVMDMVTLSAATVRQVRPVGMGDRVCVDLCSLLLPGEGLLVGSFARGLFLVHSECLQTSYIASRPFRVNAGPVHAYIAIPDGRTCYLSELQSGSEVLVVNANGMQRTTIVGRVKIESRPLMLVEATVDDMSYILLLQNAETVSLVHPPSTGMKDARHLAVPVSTLKVNDTVLISLQASARHTGIEIQEFIIEK